MSSGAEADFELGMKANFDATRALLEAIRKTCPGVRVIYASSQAVYNNSVTLPVTESQMPTPDLTSLPYCLGTARETNRCSEFLHQWHDSRTDEWHQMRYSIRRQAMATLALFSSHSSPESSLRGYRFRHQPPRKVRPLLELPWHRRLSAGHDGFAC